MSESMGKETKQNSSKSDKKNINHIDNSIESQTGRPGSILEIKDLCFAYPEEEKRALNHISFQIKEGEFLVLCGKSGCGKSTLLKHMKTPLTPHGKRKGEILFDGKNLHEMTGREQSQRIGYVLQNPDNQIVTDKVWHELAFGLESLGYKSAEIRIRVAEMASYFGIQDWFYKNVAELSGGQKQLLNLASIMAMHPDILILDEPTSQLDPIAASDFLGTVKKINRDLGTTILLTEHRLEEVFPAADRVVVMEGGEVLCMGTPEEIGEELKKPRNVSGNAGSDADLCKSKFRKAYGVSDHSPGRKKLAECDLQRKTDPAAGGRIFRKRCERKVGERRNHSGGERYLVPL